MGEIDKFEQEAGVDRLIVMLVNRDGSRQIDVHGMLAEIGRDAADRAEYGWRVHSIGSIPMRQMGTTGNFLFHSGGQYATQAAVMVVYTRELGENRPG